MLSNPLIFWVVPMRSYHFHLISCITVVLETCWSQNLQCPASAYHDKGPPSCLHVAPEGPREWLPAGQEWTPPGPAHPRTLHRQPRSVGAGITGALLPFAGTLNSSPQQWAPPPKRAAHVAGETQLTVP